MTLPKVVTAAWLSRHHACKEQVDVVKTEWPNGTEITVESLTRARELKLDTSWLMDLLPPPAWDANQKAKAPAWDAYRKAIAPAWDAYEKAKATALAEAWNNVAKREG